MKLQLHDVGRDVEDAEHRDVVRALEPDRALFEPPRVHSRRPRPIEPRELGREGVVLEVPHRPHRPANVIVRAQRRVFQQQRHNLAADDIGRRVPTRLS
eukprot:1180256-Prymnesium_polylepis.1